MITSVIMSATNKSCAPIPVCVNSSSKGVVNMRISIAVRAIAAVQISTFVVVRIFIC